MTRPILLLPGDGIGPEVVSEGRRVLEHVAGLGEYRFALSEAPAGGCAIDQHGDPLPADTLARCRDSEAILLGAVGGPRWSDPRLTVRPEQGLLRLRQELDLFANLRPVRVFPSLIDGAPLRPELLLGVDLLIVRELVSGIYFGPRSEQGEGTEAWDTMLYRRHEVDRVARVAFDAARRRRRSVTSVDKANVLASMRLWRRTVDEVARDYPDVALDHQLVDSMAMHLVRKPASFDVIVAGNMFGDILSDEAAVLASSLGMLPSASLGASGPGLYEPVHGSAPDLAGRGVANPLGTILSVALLLRHSLGYEDAAAAVERAVEATLDAGQRTADLGGPLEPLSTRAMTDAVLARLDR